MTSMSRNFMHELNTHVVPILDLLSTFSVYIRVLNITTNDKSSVYDLPARPSLAHTFCTGRVQDMANAAASVIQPYDIIRITRLFRQQERQCLCVPWY